MSKQKVAYVIISINWEEKYSTGHRKVYQTVDGARKRIAVLKQQCPNSEHAIHCVGGNYE